MAARLAIFKTFLLLDFIDYMLGFSWMYQAFKPELAS